LLLCRVEGFTGATEAPKNNVRGGNVTMRPATTATEWHGYTVTDPAGNVVTTCLTREQATALVSTMHANGIAVWIHPPPDDTNA